MFILEYLKSPRKVGAVAPSSKRLAKKMVAPIQFENCRCIVEFGPGTGVFTDEVIAQKGEDVVFILIEQNQEFWRKLHQRYQFKKNVHVVHGDASDIGLYLKKYHQQKADYIISGLPFASLPKAASQSILAAIKTTIGESGRFITFQYTMFKKSMFLHWFELEKTTYELLNFPPAFVLEMKKG
ncbi:methyltransferase domain-containing protein [Faecalicatena sp. AGMB00832]|uniref:Methyltransferase domain-containing protein n=1 Tax=Faecalicatena faecalis TaxID=2726362 RepID=A0ABS6D708_9FIRM|nr:rRNA adenine N-6-methyltransferase family protein [Faecalicatena faecalis]MBU3877253.1 methyltransferase domain-containing protein [Faecalicatena faecalis]